MLRLDNFCLVDGKMNVKTDYSAESIKVLEGLEGVRKRFDVVALSKKIKKKGDILILATELQIKPGILNSVIDEGRILAIFPKLHKIKAEIIPEFMEYKIGEIKNVC